MNFKLSQPDMLAEARKYGGRGLIVECLMFIGIFFLTQLLASAGILLVGVPYLFFSDMAGQPFDQKLVTDLFSMLTLLALIISIFATILLAKWCFKRKAWTLGFKKRNWLREYAVGMLAGFVMMTVVVLLGLVSGCLAMRFNEEILTAKNLLLLLAFFLGFLIQGMSEEVLCRGLCIISMARKKGNLWAAVILSSLLFAAAHLANPGVGILPFCNLTLFGIFAGLYFLKRGDLWGIGALHSLWNFTQGNIWGVPVSGTHSGPSIFISVPEAGSSLLIGGKFGPEGGLFVTLVLVIGILILLRLPQKDVAPETVTE